MSKVTLQNTHPYFSVVEYINSFVYLLAKQTSPSGDSKTAIHKSSQTILKHINHTLKQLSLTLDEQRLHIVPLKQLATTPHTGQHLTEILTCYYKEIEHNLNIAVDSPHTEYRFAVTFNHLYLWHRNTNPDNWLNIHQSELFYFQSKEEKQSFLDEALEQLHISSGRKLTKLIHQITHNPKPIPSHYNPLADLHRTFPYIRGRNLQFLLDAANQTLQDVGIDAVGLGVAGCGRIRSPLFKTGVEFDEFRARALAIMLSDGNLTRKYQLRYTENDRGRVEYVKRLFEKNLGQIDLIEGRVPGDVVQLKYPAVVGRIFEQWGMPKGNKLFQNVELPNYIKEGSERAKRAYLEELVPEEGYFHVRKPPYSPKFARFVINRVRILDGGENPVGYDLPSLITPEHIELINKFSTRREHVIADERRRQFGRFVFTWGRLKKKAEKAEPLSTRQALSQLKEIIEDNPPNLLRDEKDLMTSLGIQVKMYPERIILYDSGQVSVAWRLETWRVEDTIKWAVIAPPSSGYKRKRVQEWLELHREKAQRFRMLFQEK